MSTLNHYTTFHMQQTKSSSERKECYAVLSRIIKTFRKKQGLSQKDLSLASGISQGQLSKIEKGDHIPSVESLDSIAFALKVPTSLIAYLAFDRGRIEDEFSKKMFETYDVLLNFWFYVKNLEDGNQEVKTLSLEQEQAENNSTLQSVSQELLKLKNQGIKVISGSFIEEYLSSTEN